MLSSAANVLRALEYLVDEGEVGVSDLGRHLSVTVGTAHRLVSTLVETGFAVQNPQTRRYRASVKVARLADRVRGAADVMDVLHAHLEVLAATVHETVNLGVLEGSEILYVDKVLSDQMFGIEARVGTRLPAASTALGKAILSRTPDAVLERVADASSTGDLRAELTQVETDGFAEDRGEVVSDVWCVAAPITAANGEAIAAISVSVPRSRWDGNVVNLRREVVATAQAASRDAGHLGVEALPPVH